MKYDVTYSCGHEGTVELYGKTSERERKIQWLESECICPECQKKAREEVKAEVASKYDLPELEGSPKQVAWAEDIRASRIAHLAKYEPYAFAEAQQMLSGRFAELRDYKRMVERKGMTPEAAIAYLATATRMVIDPEFDKQARAGEVEIPEELAIDLRDSGTAFMTYTCQVLRALTKTSAKWFIDNRG